MIKFRNIYMITILLTATTTTLQPTAPPNNRPNIQIEEPTSKNRSIILEAKKHPLLFIAGAYVAWCAVVIGGTAGTLIYYYVSKQNPFKSQGQLTF